MKRVVASWGLYLGPLSVATPTLNEAAVLDAG